MTGLTLAVLALAWVGMVAIVSRASSANPLHPRSDYNAAVGLFTLVVVVGLSVAAVLNA